MPDRFFLDSNIIIYALGKELDKKAIAQNLLNQTPLLSTQVLTEVSNVCLKKLKLNHDLTQEWISLLSAQTEIICITPEIIQYALEVSKKYQYSFYDSLIISASIHANATILYSEDMQNGQQIETIRIINPFMLE
jgi:predicted nucleic acid-binding protein